jgi:replicative DNA helicase
MATAQSVDARERTFRRDRPAASVGAEILDRQPPCNLEAERSVIGGILLLPDVCDDVALVIKADDFYDPANAKIFRHILAMHESGKRVDVTLLVERLKTAGDYEAVGGAAYIAECGAGVVTAAHAVHYAEILRDKSTLRNLIEASTDILRDAYERGAAPRELLAQAESRVFGILEQKGGVNAASIYDVLQNAMDRIDARMQKDQVLGGVETGLTELDNLLGGLHNSELIVLAARPSMGKTALALNIAEHAALRTNVCTLFVSLEMSSLELADRMLCSAARVDGQRLRNGSLSQEERHKLVEKVNVLSQAPLFIDDSPSRTMTEIAATARRLKRKENLGLILIDYLQLIEPDDATAPRQEQVARIARRLKGMARELAVPVVCLAQLNRQAEATKDNRPRLSHLRESGAIEQDADVVMFVHREEYYRTTEEEKAEVAGQADILVAKQRNGPIGDIKATWLHKFTRFTDLAQAHYDEFDQYNSGDDF